MSNSNKIILIQFDKCKIWFTIEAYNKHKRDMETYLNSDKYKQFQHKLWYGTTGKKETVNQTYPDIR